jgi:hypothetical protein
MRLHGLKKELPFLDSIMHDERYLDNISIERMSREFLLYQPKSEEINNPLTDIKRFERIHFVLSNKKVIKDKVKCCYDLLGGYNYKKDKHQDGECILETIHNSAMIPRYIIFEETGYNIEKCKSKKNWRLTVYKPPKDFTIKQMLDEQMELIKKEIQAEFNF